MTRLTRKTTDKDYEEYRNCNENYNFDFCCEEPIKNKEEFLKEYLYFWKEEAFTTNEAIQKLGKLEDLEEELGCPLEVVFKALNNGKIYVENALDTENAKYNATGWFEIENLSYTTEDDTNYLELINSWTIDFFLRRYWNEYGIVLLKDYGKTWWLEKPEEVEE